VLAEEVSLPSPWSAWGRQEAGVAGLTNFASGTTPMVRPAPVCVLTPTRHGVGNVGPLLARPGSGLARLSGEVLLVDDSDDETPEVTAVAPKSAPVPVRVARQLPRLVAIRAVTQTGSWFALAGQTPLGLDRVANGVVHWRLCRLPLVVPPGCCQWQQLRVPMRLNHHPHH
jgi:hypothetical protein